MNFYIYKNPYKPLVFTVLFLVGVFVLVGCSQTTLDNSLPSSTVQYQLYVSPDGTDESCSAKQPCSLLQAKEKVRTLNDNMKGDIVVWLGQGVYSFRETLQFNAEDSGSNGHHVIYLGESNQQVIFSGGLRPVHWTEVGNGIYKSNVGDLRFRSLFVNGQPALRSREPDDSYYRVNEWDLNQKLIHINASEIERWDNFNQVEFVVNKHWNQQRLRLEDYTPVQAGQIRNVSERQRVLTDSSLSDDHAAAMGNDGDINTFFSSQPGVKHFWEIDLRSAYSLDRLDIVMRQDGDYEWSRKNLEVWASNNVDMSKEKVVLGRLGDTPVEHKGTWSLDITDTTPYRYLAIVNLGKEGLAFAEAQLFGASANTQAMAAVSVQNPERDLAFEKYAQWSEPQQVYYFENALEFLDTPGEFYLNTESEEVFYKPRAGEVIEESSIVIPGLETLILIDGAQHLRFEGLYFQSTDWLGPSSRGYVNSQAGPYVAGGVTVKNASNIQFYNNRFRRMGGTGLRFFSQVKDSEIVGCHFYYLGGQAITLDSELVAPATIDNVLIKNNYITQIAQQFTGNVGIFVGYASRVVIENNKIWDLPYSGISVGWGWTTEDTGTQNNQIRYNHVFDVMKLHDDGGGIYVLSNQPGTVIEENYIHDISLSKWSGGYPAVGIYLDEGSSNITVKSNVIENVATPIRENKVGDNNTLSNNDQKLQSVIDKVGPK